MKIPHIAQLLKYSLYGVICDNKANLARVELGLGLSLAINELLVTTAFVCQAFCCISGQPMLSTMTKYSQT